MKPRSHSRETPNLGNPGPSSGTFFHLLGRRLFQRPLVEELVLRKTGQRWRWKPEPVESSTQLKGLGARAR